MLGPSSTMSTVDVRRAPPTPTRPSPKVPLRSQKSSLGMTLIRSISGIRGTLGGAPGQGSHPPDVVYAAAFGTFLLKGRRTPAPRGVSCSAGCRPSGPLVRDLVQEYARGHGASRWLTWTWPPTPTVELAVTGEKGPGRHHRPPATAR